MKRLSVIVVVICAFAVAANTLLGAVAALFLQGGFFVVTRPVQACAMQALFHCKQNEAKAGQ
ncbi:MAG: hypothetical protein IJE42_01780 [Bacteroidaceae bacterium]|nr:hypothetical protein [Bacteroidaceae bacterium]